MPIYTWQTSSMDVGFIGDTVLPFRDINIPAGATLKRFQAVGCSANARHSGDDFAEIQNLSMTINVDIISGEYAPQRLYSTWRHIPLTVAGLKDDLAPDERVYSGWWGAGDNELSVDSKTSYGTAGGPGFLVRLIAHVVANPNTFAFPVGRATLQFRTLHVL